MRYIASNTHRKYSRILFNIHEYTFPDCMYVESKALIVIFAEYINDIVVCSINFEGFDETSCHESSSVNYSSSIDLQSK
jgi:hypothetical protein